LAQTALCALGAEIISACFVLGWRQSRAAHLKAKDSASSSDEIAVFQAYIDLINSERETIWTRHNALLVANSLIIGALAISPTAPFGRTNRRLLPC
jgi:hypothetical protein